MQGFDHLFDFFMLPLEKLAIQRYRKSLVPLASGDVLEIGAGTGANLSFYRNEQCRSLTITDLEPGELLHTRTRIQTGSDPLSADVQNLPFENNSFDTIVSTLVFCSVPDPQQGVEEIKRVLKPGGTIIFIEHIASCNHSIKTLQERITPLWKSIASNCHLDRPTVEIFKDAGFQISNLMMSRFCLLAAGTGKERAKAR